MSKIVNIKKRRSVTFTPTDPIQPIIAELEDMYDNALDLPSIIRISLIELKNKKKIDKAMIGGWRFPIPSEIEAIEKFEQNPEILSQKESDTLLASIKNYV
jgi:hypothetical protein